MRLVKVFFVVFKKLLKLDSAFNWIKFFLLFITKRFCVKSIVFCEDVFANENMKIKLVFKNLKRKNKFPRLQSVIDYFTSDDSSLFVS